MANTKISALPLYTGDTTGAYLVMDNSGLTETFKVLKETLIGSSGTSGSSGSSGTSGSSGSSGTSGSSGSSGTSGISGLSGFTGSWTVTPGTNNYSFTVDINNTYNLWALANIPNGIIVYNATVSVSNSNVPVIGVQYAWNYTGGGSPILFTSIPAQIIGTAGAISTASTVVTSTNTFVFGIQNNTVSGITVNYGYIKIS
jgi:hypothetical protein